MSKAEELDRITQDIIGAAIEVHRALGPGLLESAYEACLSFDLVERRHQVEVQKPLLLTYKGVKLDCAYRIDLLVDEKVVVEIKSVEQLLPIHQAQLLPFEIVWLQSRIVAQLQRSDVERWN